MPDRGPAAQGPEAVAAPPLTIEEPSQFSVEYADCVRSLVRQLSATAPEPTDEDVEELIGRGGLLLARLDDATLAGMLTLVLYRIPTGLRARIEDVVVDAAYRGRGIGEELTLTAIHLARERGARTVELTSHPSRKAANALYRKLGFERRETNVYRLALDDR